MRRKYVPDLVELSSVCERNFYKLQQLLPEFDQLDNHSFQLHGGEHIGQTVRLEIHSRHPYTTDVTLTQEAPAMEWLALPKMEVRLYHDANMAEVVSYANHHRIQGVYQYPNPKMEQPDEKRQLNLFLGEWLNHCLSHGQADITLGPVTVEPSNRP